MVVNPTGCALRQKCDLGSSVFACMHAKSLQSCLTLWDLMDCSLPSSSMWFYRQEYWSELPCPPPGNLPKPRIEPAFLMSPALLADSLPLSHWGSCSVFWGDASGVVSTAGSAASVFWSVPMTSETHSRNSSWQVLRMDSCFGSFCFFCPQTYHPFLYFLILLFL